MTAFLGISLLGWFLIVFGGVALCLGFFLGWCIHGAEEPIEEPLPQREIEPADLDDWLANEGPLEEFRVWKQPEAWVRMDRGAV